MLLNGKDELGYIFIDRGDFCFLPNEENHYTADALRHIADFMDANFTNPEK